MCRLAYPMIPIEIHEIVKVDGISMLHRCYIDAITANDMITFCEIQQANCALIFQTR